MKKTAFIFLILLFIYKNDRLYSQGTGLSSITAYPGPVTSWPTSPMTTGSGASSTSTQNPTTVAQWYATADDVNHQSDWLYSIVATPEKEYIGCGYTSPSGVGDYDATIMKLNNVGGLAWSVAVSSINRLDFHAWTHSGGGTPGSSTVTISSLFTAGGNCSLWRVAKAKDGYVAVGGVKENGTYGYGILVVEFDSAGNFLNGTPVEIIAPANPGGATGTFYSSNSAGYSFTDPYSRAYCVAIDPNTNSINNIIIGGSIMEHNTSSLSNNRAYMLTLNYSSGWSLGNTFYGGNNFGSTGGLCGGNVITKILTQSTGSSTYNVYACGAISYTGDNVNETQDPYGNALTGITSIPKFVKDIWLLSTNYNSSSNNFGTINYAMYGKGNIYIGGYPLTSVNSVTYPYQSMGPLTARNYAIDPGTGDVTGIWGVEASTASPSSWVSLAPNASIWLSAPFNNETEASDMIFTADGNLAVITLINVVGNFVDNLDNHSPLPAEYGLLNSYWNNKEYGDGDAFLLKVNPSTLGITYAKNVGHFSGADFTMSIKQDQLQNFIITGSTADMLGSYSGTYPSSITGYTSSSNPNMLDPTLSSAGSGWNAFIAYTVDNATYPNLWQRSFLAEDSREGGLGYNETTFCVFGMDTTADGGYLICGNNKNNNDDWSTVKFSPTVGLGYFPYYNFGSTGVTSVYGLSSPPPDVYTITGSEVWNAVVYGIASKIIIAPTGSLTIENGSIVNFAASNELWDYFAFPSTFGGGNQGCGIIVEPGGQLYINNSTVAGMTYSGISLPTGGTNPPNRNMWDGCVIQGNPGVTGGSAQGQATISNGSIVQDAISGLYVADNYRTYIQEYPYTTGGMYGAKYGSAYIGYSSDGGGIVNVQNSTFQNCYNAATFNSYPYHDRSLFYNNTFACNSSGLADICTYTDFNGRNQPSSTHIVVTNAFGITYAGNTFSCDPSFPYTERSTGIFCLDGGISATTACIGSMSLSGVCSGTSVPGNNFQNLATGIWANNTGVTAAIKNINSNTFDNCGYGILEQGSTNTMIATNNSFLVPGYNLGGGGGGFFTYPISWPGGYLPYYPMPAGVTLAGCNGYDVSENTFDKCSACSSLGSWAGNRGVIVNNQSGANTKINLNKFNNVYNATIAAQANAGTMVVSGVSISTGLQVLCNNFYQSLVDIDRNSTLLGSGTIIPATMKPQQGSCISSTSPAGNEFNSACYSSNSYLHADDTHVAQMVTYNNNLSGSVFDPGTCIESSIYTNHACATTGGVSYASVCPPPSTYVGVTSTSTYTELAVLDGTIGSTTDPTTLAELQAEHDVLVAYLARYYSLNEYFDSAAALLLSYNMYADAVPFLMQSGDYTQAATALGSMPLSTAGDTLYYYLMSHAITTYSGGGTWLSDTSYADTIRHIVQYNSPAGYMAGAIGLTEGIGVMKWPIPIPDTAAMDSLLTALSDTGGRRAYNIAPGSNGNQSEGMSFTVYPNPTYGGLTVQASVSGTFILYTMLGQEIRVYAVTAGQAGLQLPASLAPGMYLGKFNPDNGTAAKEVRIVYQP